MVGAAQMTVSQETFDAAVRDAMEDFELSLDEAVDEARTQFKLAGVTNLDSMIWSGSQASQNETALLTELESLAPDAFIKAIRITSSDESLRRRLAMSEVALRSTISAMSKDCSDSQMAALSFIFTLCSGGGAESPRLLLGRLGGVHRIREILVATQSVSPFAVQVLKAAQSAVYKVESNKVILAASPSLDSLLVLMRQAVKQGASTNDERAILQNGCALIKTLLAPDDNTTATSEAFPRARVLAGCPTAQSSGLKTLKVDFSAVDVLSSLISLPGLDAVLCVAALAGIRGMAISDQICGDLVERGTAEKATNILMGGPQVEVCRAALGLLRNLAGRDQTKDSLCRISISFNDSPMHAVLSTMESHERDPSVVEQCCGVIAAVTLRRPNHAEKISAGGGLTLVVRALRNHSTNIPVTKAACLAIRNLAARSPAVKSAVAAEEELESLLRAIKDPGAHELARSALFECGWLADSELRSWDRKKQRD